MFREQEIDRHGIGELIGRNRQQFLLTFMMCVLGDRRIFNILGPAVGPNGHIEGGAHFWRTIPPIVTGYTDPGDGSYAEALRAAHKAANFPLELVAETVNWLNNILCELAIKEGHHDLVVHLVRASKCMARDFDSPAGAIGYNPDVLRLTFDHTTIQPAMNNALWGVLAWPKLAELLGYPTPNKVLRICRQLLPGQFVDQFAPDA